MRISAFALSLCLLVPGTLLAEPVLAGDRNEKFWIRVEGYLPTVNSSVRVGNSQTGQVGTIIDLEEDLALSKRRTLPLVAGGVALGDSWQINAEYYSLSRQGSLQLQREIVFDGATYPISTDVESEFNSDVYRLTVGYLISKGAKHQLGVGVGAHITGFSARIEGQVTGSNGTLTLASRRREVLAPLPTLGLFGSYEPLPRVILGVRADYLSLKVDEYDGRLLNLEASASYKLSKTFALGLGYRKVDYRLRVSKRDWNGEVDYSFHGPAIFARAAF